MTTTTTLSPYRQLRHILTRSGLLWVSETDCEIEALTIKPSQVKGWKEENNALGRLQVQWEMGGMQWQPLIDFFADKELRAFTRPNGRPSEYSLLIVFADGYNLTGIKIETVVST